MMSFPFTPPTFPSLVFLSFSTFPFSMLYFVSPRPFHFWHLFFSHVPDVILPFPSFYLLHRRASTAHHYLSTSHPLPHLFFTFPPEQGMKRELPALFSSFFTPDSLFLSSRVAVLPPTPPTHHPCRLPSDCLIRRREWNLVTFLISRRWDFFSERVTVGGLSVCACVRESGRERDRYSGVSSFRLSILESKQQGKRRIGSEKGKQKRGEPGRERCCKRGCERYMSMKDLKWKRRNGKNIDKYLLIWATVMKWWNF